MKVPSTRRLLEFKNLTVGQEKCENLKTYLPSKPYYRAPAYKKNLLNLKERSLGQWFLRTGKLF